MTHPARIKDLPDLERPRERMAALGANALSHAELIAILLRTGMRGQSAIDIGSQLIRDYGDLHALAQASIEDLQRVKGIGRDKAVTLKAAFTLARRMAAEIRATRPQLDNPEAIADHLRDEFRGKEVEEFHVVLLDTRRRLIRSEQVTTGILDSAIVHAREVFARLASARDEIAALKKVLRGRLAIGTSDTNCTYILPGLLAEFRARYPEVELDIRNRMSPEVGNLVLNDEVEFGLATLPVKHRDLVGEVLFARRDVLICPPDHALAARRRIGLKQIVAHPFLALERGSTSRQLLDEVCRREGLELQVEMNLGGIEIIKRYVEIGLGIALVPEVAVEEEVAAGRRHGADLRHQARAAADGDGDDLSVGDDAGRHGRADRRGV